MATTDKYDRQLRLWGAKGQRALGNTEVVLVGASAAGTETLKNLVLPGIGSFTVIDSGTVSTQDAASNFFLPIVGKGRAEIAAEYLRELNPDVMGSFLEVVDSLQGVSDWYDLLYKKNVNIKENPEKKLLVIASDLVPNVLESLSSVCNANKIPMIVVQSYGLIGVVRIQLSGKVPLLDPKPTNSHPDLRLMTSFPALDAMADSIDMANLENHLHSHVPYPIILLKALNEWKRLREDGKAPSNFAEKQEFQAFVKAKRRDVNEINFEEAVQNAYLAYTKQSVDIPSPSDLDESSMLGKLYKGLQTFMAQSNNRPPLNGSIPDMTASTDYYVQLQTIYKEQAEADLKLMKELCGGVPEDEIETFCANIFTVEQIQTRSLIEEFTSPPDEEMLDDLSMSLMDPYEVPEHTPLLWYLGIRACQVFYTKHQRYPGITADESWESDASLLKTDGWDPVVEHYKLNDQELVQTHGAAICQELTRYANAEIHNISSIVGGVASQEAVKIITGQYIPLDDTYVFNGIVSVAGVYKL